MDLSAFGHRLRHLRKTAGLTQSALSDKIRVTTSLIWNWEKAYEYRGRHWIPDRDLVLHLIKIFAKQLTPGEAQQWAEQAGHHLSQADLQAIFPTHWAQAPVQLPPLPSFYVPRPEAEQSLLNQLEQSRTLVLVGQGGIGKTTLAIWATHILANRFPDGVIWVESPASNDISEAQNWIARSFGVTLDPSSTAERAALLRTLLHDRECLLILDDVWATPELLHLQVVNEQSYLLLTSRDAKVADLLNCPRLKIDGMTATEGQALLAAWTGQTVEAENLVTRLGGLPLALSLSGAQVRAGHLTMAELWDYFEQVEVDLGLLDLDIPQSRRESLNLCFDLSYRRLDTREQQRFAQLSCFTSSFEEKVIAAVWGVGLKEMRRGVRQLRRFALLEQGERGFRLHPLLRDYARQQLAAWPELAQETYHRHAAWYIRFILYHPGVLEDIPDLVPELDPHWVEIVQAIKWTIHYEPQLAAWAVLLAHRDRSALLEEFGLPLMEAVTAYVLEVRDRSQQAIWQELLGDLYLLQNNFQVGLSHFEQAVTLWEKEQSWLSSAHVRVRIAGIYLLLQNQASATTKLKVRIAKSAHMWETS